VTCIFWLIWCWFTSVDPEKGPLNEFVVCCHWVACVSFYCYISHVICLVQLHDKDRICDICHSRVWLLPTVGWQWLWPHLRCPTRLGSSFSCVVSWWYRHGLSFQVCHWLCCSHITATATAAVAELCVELACFPCLQQITS